MGNRLHVSPDELAAKIDAGDIDTVLMVFPDLQGRLVGKRTTGRFYLDHVSGPEGTENCNYLIATDMDDNPVPGYEFTSYELGYGDMRAVIDPDTIRITPWIERTALVMCDLFDVDSGAPIEVAPRQVLRRQVETGGRAGLRADGRVSEIEFYLFRDSYEQAHAKGYRDLEPHSAYLEDYAILQTTKDEYIIGQIRRHLEAAGVPVEFSKGEAGKGQHEINLDYTTARRDGRPQHRLQERRQGDRRAQRPLDLVHGEVRLRRDGFVVPHPLEPLVGRRHGTARCTTHAASTA